MAGTFGFEPDKSDQQNDQQRRVLAAASALVIEAGLSQLTVREVAKRAGFSTMIVYKHYSNKAGLLDALFIEGFETLIAMQREVLAEQHSAKDCLIQLCLGYRRVALKFPAHYQIMLRLQSPSHQPSLAATHVARQSLENLQAACQHYLDHSNGQGLEAQALARHLFVASHGLVSMELSQYTPAPAAESLFLEHIKAVLRGLVSEATG